MTSISELFFSNSHDDNMYERKQFLFEKPVLKSTCQKCLYLIISSIEIFDPNFRNNKCIEDIIVLTLCYMKCGNIKKSA